jgi:predicted metal-dependent hydrolase
LRSHKILPSRIFYFVGLENFFGYNSVMADPENKISYRIRNSSTAKRLRIAVFYNGDVLVTKPRRVSYGFIEKIVRSKASWILDKINKFKMEYPESVPGRRDSRVDYLENRERAREFIIQRIGEINKLYNFNFGRISIKNHRSLWGSCSKKGNLNFNYRIINLPAPLADYIVVHELCHLKELNHSANFWKLVALTVPDHKKLRRELKTFKIY